MLLFYNVYMNCCGNILRYGQYKSVNVNCLTVFLQLGTIGIIHLTPSNLTNIDNDIEHDIHSAFQISSRETTAGL